MTDVTTNAPPAFVPNQGQQDAADHFFSFLFTPEKEMGITGPGGVGKTALMGHMTDQVMPQYLDTCKMMGIPPKYDSVHWTATTNKATEVLSLASGKPATTLASFLNLKVAGDYETGEQKLTKKRDWTVHENTILFVDECSMVDSPLYNLVHEGTVNCKIIWVGDHCQMAPIKEPLSPVYRNGITHVELTQPMRTTIPELHALNWQLRHTVETGEFKPIQIVPGIIDWFDDAQMEAAIAADFMSQTLTSRILAYTNARVMEFNDHVRGLRGLPAEFTEGEFLISNSAVPLKKYMLSVEEEVEILSINQNPFALTVDTWEGQDVDVMYRFADIRTRLGMVFRDVKIPIDRKHFADTVNWLARRKAWSKMYGLKDAMLDLRQRDASTVYKAQGSTLDTVYIDASNLSRSNNPSQAARMLYVAGSRARKRVVFYGSLSEKYGGLIC